ncbi:plasma membrane ascorbate-dependent reductase CYBRD1-like [Amphiura filiformis]|uniref:plasma membrane ascorbate-dependent reductase CYBRD1-like n=1 Tax=Amphiura filiformis TaxID=82378 RepID=UPI003B21BC1F
MDPTRRKRTLQTLSTIVFWSTQILAHITGIVLLVATGVWVSKYFGGFNWGQSPGTFSYHAFFGILGLVVVCGEAILFIEVPKRLSLSVIVQKAVHATIHTCALIFTIVSLSAAILNKNIINYSHLYSLHSWLGLMVIIVFFLQYVVACVIYGVARRVGDWLTDLYQNTHAYIGLFTFALAVATCLTGFMEKVAAEIDNYWNLPPEAVLANICCILLVIFSACVAYCASRPTTPSAEATTTYVEEHTADSMDKDTNEKQEGEV